LDVVLLAASFIAATLLHFDGHTPESMQQRLPLTLAIAVAVTMAGLAWMRVYRKINDFVSVHDFVGLARGMTVAFLVLVIGNALAPKSVAVPWVLLLRFFVLAGCVMALGLFKMRLWRETPLGHARRTGEDAPGRRPLLVYGAGRAGSAVGREVLESPELAYELRGYVDDDASKWGKEIHGVPVLGGRHDLPRLVGPDLREIVLAIPSLDAGARREILGHCRRAGAHVRIVPGLAELLRHGSFVHQIRDVRVEDLLPRDTVDLDEGEVREQLTGETVLVTGAAGSIGSELCHQILRHEPRQLILVEQSESRLYYLEMDLVSRVASRGTQLVPVVADICDRDRMELVLKTYRPSHIFHAAAYKHVPMMQKNPQEAIRNNVFGTHVVAMLARQYRVGYFVLVSTDKAVEPSSVMGASKRVAELVVRELAEGSQTRFMAVRFGNVLDSDGSVVPLFKKQIAAGGPITITHPEMERFFMTIPEAARLILQATTVGQGGEVFVLEMGRPVKILDLARSLVELSGLRFMEDIHVTFSGMRPGEKLTEKLFFDHEKNVTTRIRQIHVAQLENGRRLDVEGVLRSLQLLLRSAADEKDLALRFMAIVSGLDQPESALADARPATKPQVVPLPVTSGASG
jgi:FlaA1/EpsC-like NDP-sugar epimerase